MREVVDELVELWEAGKPDEVVAALGRLHPLQAALAGAYLYDALSEYHQGVLGRVLQRAMPEVRRG